MPTTSVSGTARDRTVDDGTFLASFDLWLYNNTGSGANQGMKTSTDAVALCIVKEPFGATYSTRNLAYKILFNNQALNTGQQHIPELTYTI